MKKNHTLFALGLLLCVVLACQTLRKISSRETLYEGTNMQEAVAAFKEKIGAPVKATTLEITADTATLRAQDPKQPENINEYRYSRGFCTGPVPVQFEQLGIFESRLDRSLFALDEVDLAAMPQVVKEALSRTNLEGGQVRKITIERDLANTVQSATDSYVVLWKIEIQGTRESASAIANAKGEIVGVDLSRTARAGKQSYLTRKALQDAVRDIKQEFGGQVYLADFIDNGQFLWFKAATSPTSDEVHQYKYDLNGVTRDMHDVRPLTGYKYHEIYFTLDEIDFSKTYEVLKTAFAKSGFPQPLISQMTFTRPTAVYPDAHQVKPIEWMVTVDEKGKNNYKLILFDAKGNFQEKRGRQGTER